MERRANKWAAGGASTHAVCFSFLRPDRHGAFRKFSGLIGDIVWRGGIVRGGLDFNASRLDPDVIGTGPDGINTAFRFQVQVPQLRDGGIDDDVFLAIFIAFSSGVTSVLILILKQSPMALSLYQPLSISSITVTVALA